MGPGGVDPRAAAGPRLWLTTAVGVIVLGVLVLLLVDIRTSVHEARVLRSGAVCTGGIDSERLAQETVVLGPYNDARRTRVMDAYVRNVGAEPGDSDLVGVLPADHDQVLDLGERAGGHRVGGRLVALSGTGDAERIPLGWTGIHGVLVGWAGTRPDTGEGRSRDVKARSLLTGETTTTGQGRIYSAPDGPHNRWIRCVRVVVGWWTGSYRIVT